MFLSLKCWPSLKTIKMFWAVAEDRHLLSFMKPARTFGMWLSKALITGIALQTLSQWEFYFRGSSQAKMECPTLCVKAAGVSYNKAVQNNQGCRKHNFYAKKQNKILLFPLIFLQWLTCATLSAMLQSTDKKSKAKQWWLQVISMKGHWELRVAHRELREGWLPEVHNQLRVFSFRYKLWYF